MSAWWAVALVAGIYAGAAFLGVKLGALACRRLVPFSDGPAPASPPVVALIVSSAIVGGAIASRGAGVLTLAIVCVLAASLAACSYSDVRCGIVPDAFTLVPLGIVLAISLVQRDPAPAVAAVVVFIPFAVMALMSRGRGMGWGDAKLVALGAAVLGLEPSILAFAAACLAAAAVAAARRRFREPIAFAPYLSAGIACACIFPVLPT